MKRLRDHVILISGTLIMALPLALVFVSATRTSGDLAQDGVSLRPGTALWDNISRFSELAGAGTPGPNLRDMLSTSLVAGSGVALLTTALSFLAAYAMVFFRLKGSSFWFGLVLLTLYFPVEARMLPTFDVAAGLGLINTTLGLVLPILPLALGTFLFRQHMKSFPPELMEAARIDGAGPLTFLKDFVLPLSLAPLGAVLVITFILGWNQYLWPLMISVDNSQFTLMRGLGLVGQQSGSGMVLAAISVLPPLLLVVAFQRWISRLTSLRL